VNFHYESTNMKLIALQLITKQVKVFDLLPDDIKTFIPKLFVEGYDRILASHKDELVLLELVDDRTKRLNTRVQRTDDVVYTKTRLTYHPLMHML